ncbi:MAG: permease [Kiritimatiellae bacterium]|nr:permease [Kiritimatiellia bacterium]
MSRTELRRLLAIGGVFALLYWLPVDSPRLQSALVESLRLARWYAREHVLLCLVPALFIAGGIAVFVSQAAVLRYFGPTANRWLAYTVASVSGTVLAVCSCTVLPLFGGIYLRGAGLGPAIVFLYSGPAINVLAIVLTARVLGAPLGVARGIGAVLFSVVIGLLMQLMFRREEERRGAVAASGPPGEGSGPGRPLWAVAVHFAAMVGVLVFANWARPPAAAGLWWAVYRTKWGLSAVCAGLLAVSLWRFFGVRPWKLLLAATPSAVAAAVWPHRPVLAFTFGVAGLTALLFGPHAELRAWRDETWGFARQILPLLLVGVLAAGFFLGSPEHTDAGIIPNRWVQALVGDSPCAALALLGGDGAVCPRWLEIIWPVWTNLFASVAGALMYFATLTEVPILRGLIDSGMGQGPALALLLAGPALSLPNMLVINSILGPRKTLTYIGLVVAMASLSGLLFGMLMG